MKRGLLLLFCLLLAFCAVPAVSAVSYEIESLEITPTTADIAPGERITVQVTVELTDDPETFPIEDTLEAYTELDDFSWVYSIQVGDHGEDVTETKRYLYLNGWLLAYPNKNTVTVNYYLEGKAPSVSNTGETLVFRLRQLDDYGELIKDGEYSITKNVINPEDVKTAIGIMEAELSALRSELDSRSADGVNTAAAEEKYDAAEQAVNSAKTASYNESQTHLDNAAAYVDEAESLLDEAWAQRKIEDAQEQIDAVDDMLNYFKVNRSMSSDSRVIKIETKLDGANTRLTLAKDKQASGEYNMARTYAGEAENKAEEAYNASLSLKEEIGEGFVGVNFGGMTTYIIIGAVLIVIAVVGIALYRRRTKWDELG